MTELIKIEERNGRRAVNARELHNVLEVGRDFSNWIKDRISKYGFIENQDFEVFTKISENHSGGRPSKEYALSIDMAKELSMITNNEIGRKVRRYFIKLEKEHIPSYLIEDRIKRAERWIEEEKQRQELSSKNKLLTDENEIMKPKAEYFDGLVDTDMLTNFRNTAKELGIKERVFIKFMLDNKYLYRTKSGRLEPFSVHTQDGLFAVKDFKSGKYSSTRTLLTPKGKSHFRVLFGRNNEGCLF